jgi:hypothetical protein
MHLIVFANPLENDFATSVNHPLMRWYPSYPMASGRCYAPGCVLTGVSRRRNCPLYLGFFQFVHNTRRRGKALLGALIAALVA